MKRTFGRLVERLGRHPEAIGPMLIRVLPKVREEQCDAAFGKMGEGLLAGWSVARMVRRRGKVRAAHVFLDERTVAYNAMAGDGVVK